MTTTNTKTFPPFSALYRPPRSRERPPTDKVVLTHWEVEPDPQFPDPHTNFNPVTGEYTIPTDGLYTLIVQIIPINGATLISAARRRRNVDYALRLNYPPPPNPPRNPAPSSASHPDTSALHGASANCPAQDTVHTSFLDVGSVNFGELKHLSAGTRLACIKMPGATDHECIRLKVELVQRKRKRTRPELTRKQLKKRRKDKRKFLHHTASPQYHRHASSSAHDTDSSRHDHQLVLPARRSHTPDAIGNGEAADSNDEWDDDSSSDSEWDFDSDSTSDELLHSKKGVIRLAKRLRASATASSEPSVPLAAAPNSPSHNSARPVKVVRRSFN